jgi:hypothetical protein
MHAAKDKKVDQEKNTSANQPPRKEHRDALPPPSPPKK